jgi:hypothetical protein
VRNEAAKLNLLLCGPTTRGFVESDFAYADYCAQKGYDSQLTAWQNYQVTGDYFLRYFTSLELLEEPDVDFARPLHYLRASREFRANNPLTNKVSKKMCLTMAGGDSTAYKFVADYSGFNKILHIGNGRLGCVSDLFIPGEIAYADPLFNGKHWQDIDFDDYDLVVSDVATSDGLGLSRNSPLIRKLVNGSCSIYKCRLDEVRHGVIAKVRPHNLEVVCDTRKGKDLAAVEQCWNALVGANAVRNALHLGIGHASPPFNPRKLWEDSRVGTIDRQLRHLRRVNFTAAPFTQREHFGEFSEIDFQRMVEIGEQTYPIEVIPLPFKVRPFSSIQQGFLGEVEGWSTRSAANLFLQLQAQSKRT